MLAACYLNCLGSLDAREKKKKLQTSSYCMIRLRGEGHFPPLFHLPHHHHYPQDSHPSSSSAGVAGKNAGLELGVHRNLAGSGWNVRTSEKSRIRNRQIIPLFHPTSPLLHNIAPQLKKGE